MESPLCRQHHARRAEEERCLQQEGEVHVDDAYAEMCGAISVDDLMAIYARYYSNEYSVQELEHFLLHGGPDAYTRFDYWTSGRRSTSWLRSASEAPESGQQTA